MDDGRDLVRSYSRLNRMERRLYRFTEQLAVPRPDGLAFRTIGYCLAIVAVMGVVQLTPVLRDIVGPDYWPVRFILLPLVVTGLLTQVTPDGRPGHRYAWSVASLQARRAWWWLGDLRAPVLGGTVGFRHDEHSPDLRRCRVTGPATVRLRDSVALRPVQDGWRASPGAGTHEVVLGVGERLEVQPDRPEWWRPWRSCP